MENETVIQERINTVLPLLDERQKRLFLASEARSIGWGGISLISRISGADRETISRGMKEIQQGKIDLTEDGTDNSPVKETRSRMRKRGGGRKGVASKDPEIIAALLALVDKESYGNPENPLRWTCKSTRILAEELTKEGHPISHNAVYDLLSAQGFTMQTNRKLMQSGKQHPDRNEQFRDI